MGDTDEDLFRDYLVRYGHVPRDLSIDDVMTTLYKVRVAEAESERQMKARRNFYFDAVEASFYEKVLDDNAEKIDTSNVIIVDFKNKRVLSR